MINQNETLLFNRQSGGPLHVLNCFPNTYAVGMASLGFQSIFKLYASNPNTHTFRYFTDWSENHPKDIDLMTFSISWELDFINLLEIFKQLNIPFKAADRGPEHPLILGGGPVLTANPEPWAEFFDLIAIGDCEENTGQIIETCLDVITSEAKQSNAKDWIATPTARNDGLITFSKIPGIYIPALKNKVQRQKSKSSDLQMSSVIAPDSAWQDTALLEVARSCPEMCRFCMASYLSLPFRAAPLEQNLIPKADQLLEYSNNIGLLGASVTQHPEFMDLLKYLVKHPKKPKVQVASMRASTVTKEMCELLVESGTKNLTIAIETGSQRLRDIINKKLPEEFIFSACQYAFEGGIKQVKLYGMVGLPHETEADIDATIDLLTRLKAATPQLKIVWGCSIFTPKAQTPFQDYGVDKTAESKLKRLIKALKPQGIDVREESYKWAQVQALISRGDRSINDVLIKVHQSKNTGFGIYKKLLDPIAYKHFVFDDWDAMTESLPEKLSGARLAKNGEAELTEPSMMTPYDEHNAAGGALRVGLKYPWQNLVTEKQAKMLEEHKRIANSLS